jgi:hypothetical protein
MLLLASLSTLAMAGFVLLVLGPAGKNAAAAGRESGVPAEQRIVVVESNLLIPGNSTVITAPLGLDGFARWGFQVTVRSGFHVVGGAELSIRRWVSSPPRRSRPCTWAAF